MRDLSRLLRPRSVALFGGGWAENVIAQLRGSDFPGPIWPVHPTRAAIGGIPCLPDLAALPAPPDAAFVGVNREATVEVVARLAASGAGGAIAFASGFLECEDTGGAALQARLVAVAGDMAVLGPNCYGLAELPRQRHALARRARRPAGETRASPSSRRAPTSPSTSPCSAAPCRSPMS